MIDYNAIKKNILSKENDNDKYIVASKSIPGASSVNSQRLITLYQKDYPLEKYNKHKRAN